MKRQFRTYNEVAAPEAERDVLGQVAEQQSRLDARLATVKHIVLVASGKGGVGKSALAANLAVALAHTGQRVGAADADLNGPSLARMLGAAGRVLTTNAHGVSPAEGIAGVRVMSMDLLLPADDAPLRWKTPDAPAFLWQSTLEAGVLREFLADVRWGELDCLVIDAPPGTDKVMRVLQMVPRTDTLLLVTTPSEIARLIVSKSVRLARDAGARRIGLVLNMSVHVCEACGHRTPLFVGDGASEAAPDIETWAEIPFDRRLALTTDRGRAFVLEYPHAPAARAIYALAERVGGELRTPETGELAR